MTLDEAIAILKSPEGVDETRRVYKLNRAVEVAERLIATHRTMTREQAEEVVDHVASIAETLFPGSRNTFDIVYARRMRRVIAERFGAGD